MADPHNTAAAANADAGDDGVDARPPLTPPPPPPWWQAADPAITASIVVGDVLAGVVDAAAVAAYDRRLSAAEPTHLLRRLLAEVRRSVNTALPRHDCGVTGPPVAGVFSGYMAPLAGARPGEPRPHGPWALGDVDEPLVVPIDSWARGVVPLRQQAPAARPARTRPEQRPSAQAALTAPQRRASPAARPAGATSPGDTGSSGVGRAAPAPALRPLQLLLQQQHTRGSSNSGVPRHSTAGVTAAPVPAVKPPVPVQRPLARRRAADHPSQLSSQPQLLTAAVDGGCDDDSDAEARGEREEQRRRRQRDPASATFALPPPLVVRRSRLRNRSAPPAPLPGLWPPANSDAAATATDAAAAEVVTTTDSDADHVHRAVAAAAAPMAAAAATAGAALAQQWRQPAPVAAAPLVVFVPDAAYRPLPRQQQLKGHQPGGRQGAAAAGAAGATSKPLHAAVGVPVAATATDVLGGVKGPSVPAACRPGVLLAPAGSQWCSPEVLPASDTCQAATLSASPVPHRRDHRTASLGTLGRVPSSAAEVLAALPDVGDRALARARTSVLLRDDPPSGPPRRLPSPGPRLQAVTAANRLHPPLDGPLADAVSAPALARALLQSGALGRQTLRASLRAVASPAYDVSVAAAKGDAVFSTVPGGAPQPVAPLPSPALLGHDVASLRLTQLERIEGETHHRRGPSGGGVHAHMGRLGIVGCSPATATGHYEAGGAAAVGANALGGHRPARSRSRGRASPQRRASIGSCGGAADAPRAVVGPWATDSTAAAGDDERQLQRHLPAPLAPAVSHFTAEMTAAAPLLLLPPAHRSQHSRRRGSLLAVDADLHLTSGAGVLAARRASGEAVALHLAAPHARAVAAAVPTAAAGCG
jgi:hypothetical protein